MILSITLLAACMNVVLASDDKSFHAGPPSEYAHQQSENVTVGAKQFTSEESIDSAFGKKIDFSKYGVVPVLVVIENKREKALDLRDLEASLVASDGRHTKSVAPEDLPFLATMGKHGSQTGVRVPVPLPKKKNPLNSPEIVTRAFSAKMLSPGDSASGFLYFEAQTEAGDKLYLDGMRDARSGQALLYFEFPLTP
ncbi:MAG: hypothetical protein JO210_17565 [Acidobacteriaceae bacterium]|nr:hypothetical protein [Acidobacteriaceae bacterium]